MSAARVCKEQSDYVKCSRASRDSCSSPQQSRLSRCLRTCCKLLGACEWVALRPRLRCLLLLEDGRLASEHCPSACASARLPTAPPIDLPVYYIALRSAPRRAAVLEPQLARVARARDVRRVEAVTADEALAMMLDGRLVIDGSPPSRAVALKLRFGVACTLSHLRVYRMAVHDGHDQVLVLEDDVSLRSALLWPSSLREMSAASSAPDRWDVLQLVSNAPNAYATQEKSGVSGLGGGRHAWRQWHTDATFGSAAYVIQLRAMRRLLSAIDFRIHGSNARCRLDARSL